MLLVSFTAGWFSPTEPSGKPMTWGGRAKVLKPHQFHFLMKRVSAMKCILRNWSKTEILVILKPASKKDNNLQNNSLTYENWRRVLLSGDPAGANGAAPVKGQSTKRADDASSVWKPAEQRLKKSQCLSWSSWRKQRDPPSLFKIGPESLKNLYWPMSYKNHPWGHLEVG